MKDLKRIVLVEDNPHDAELALTALQELNLAKDVLVLSDGVEALDYLYCRGLYERRDDGHPAVILLDVNMPKMSGVGVLRTIKHDERLRAIPVVMLTSSREERDLAECYKMGMNAYVVKPVDFQEFVHVMTHLGTFWALVNEHPQCQPILATHTRERTDENSITCGASRR
jgi:CheY-like chemotaxis protein